MKKIIALLLVLTLVLSGTALAACGGGGGGAVVDNGGGETTNGGEGGEGNGGANGGESLGDILGHMTGLESVSYVMEITTPDMPTMTTHVYTEKNKFRSEMDQQGLAVVYLANYDIRKAYMYMPDQNMAVEMDLSQVPPPDYDKVQDITGYDYDILGTQTMDGKECLVVEYSYGGLTVKSWIWKAHGFPVRTESTAAGGTTVIVYKDIDFGDIPDNMFELPEGVQIMSSQ